MCEHWRELCEDYGDGEVCNEYCGLRHTSVGCSGDKEGCKDYEVEHGKS